MKPKKTKTNTRVICAVLKLREQDVINMTEEELLKQLTFNIGALQADLIKECIRVRSKNETK